MAKVESTDDNLYDGKLLLSNHNHKPPHPLIIGLYGDEFEEDFAVSALGNPTTITDPSGDVTPTEFLEPSPEDPSFATPTTATTSATANTTALPLETDVAQPIPTFDSSRPRSSTDASLPPKPNSSTSNGAAAGTPLSYSAQVAEQFSSSYRQTPSQERSRLDAARLAQFNQSGGPSGSPTTAAAGAVVIVDGQARPVRPSEMKDEGCVFQSLHSIVLWLPRPSGMGGGGSIMSVCMRVCVCVCPTFYPVISRVLVLRKTVRPATTLAVVSTRTRVFSLCYTPSMLWLAWMASRLTLYSLFSLFHILLPRCQHLLLSFSAMSLCYAYAYAYAPLCISPPLSITSVAVLCATLQQDVCRRLILGYNRWYFISFSSFYPPLFANVIVETFC